MQVDAIRDLVRRGAARHPELRCKLEHAAFIALFRQVSPELDGTWCIGSERDATTSYRVNLNAELGTAYCSCQDSLRHAGDECKHSLAAVMFSRALLGLERHQVFDEPIALVTNGPTRVVPIDVDRDNGAATYDRISRFEGAN